MAAGAWCAPISIQSRNGAGSPAFLLDLPALASDCFDRLERRRDTRSCLVLSSAPDQGCYPSARSAPPQPASIMQLFLRTLAGTTSVLSVPSGSTVGDLKAAVEVRGAQGRLAGVHPLGRGGAWWHSAARPPRRRRPRRACLRASSCSAAAGGFWGTTRRPARAAWPTRPPCTSPPACAAASPSRCARGGPEQAGGTSGLLHIIWDRLGGLEALFAVRSCA